MVIGLAAGSYIISPGDEDLLGGENLEETLTIGDFTGTNIIDHNFATGQTRQLGTGNAEEHVGTTDVWYVTNDPVSGGFNRSWYWFDNISACFGAGDGGNGLGTSFCAENEPEQITIWNAGVNFFILGGLNVTIATTISGDCEGVAIGGRNSVINITSKNSGVFCGTFGTVNAGILRSAIIAGSNITADKNDYLFTENLEVQAGIAAYTIDPTTNIAWADRSIPDRKFVTDSINYVEKFGTVFNNTLNSDWEVINVPGAGSDKLIQVLITNTSGAARTGGIRKVGSSLERVGGTNSDSYIGTVMTDSSGDIEIFAENFSDIDFRLYGEQG